MNSPYEKCLISMTPLTGTLTRRLAAVLIALFGAILFLISQAAYAQKFKVIYTFKGSPDGGNPEAGLVLDAAGNLYGTTYSGGDPGCEGAVGCGTVFELSRNSGGWSESVLYSFTGGADGGNPADGLIFDKAGNLYGATENGGAAGCTYGLGVVFELSLGSGGWSEDVLYSFQPTDGCGSFAGVVFDKSGSLYGTHTSGQKNGQGIGSIYRLTKGTEGWKETILYAFDGKNSEPIATPILDAVGNVYGTTLLPGGSVWELRYGNWREKTLHEFLTKPDGGNPWAGLVFDKHGNLYGTTRAYGKFGDGVVFKLTRGAGGRWKETLLHDFRGGSDGSQPFSTPIVDQAGNVYGTTILGGGTGCGGMGCGTVFKLTPLKDGSWKETVLHRFSGGSGGYGPFLESLVLDATGNLYGTATFGGDSGCFQNSGCGVVFEIRP